MAGIILTSGEPPRIARVETGAERPAWLGGANKLDEEKKIQNTTLKSEGGEQLEMCHQVAYYLVAKFLRRKLKNMTVPEAVAWLEEKEHWLDPKTVDKRIKNRWRKNMPLMIDDNITPNLPTLIELLDEWLKNANSYTGNLWLGGEKLNAAKGHFLKEAMNSMRTVGLGAKLYGPYNRVYYALTKDIVALDSLGNTCNIKVSTYAQGEGGAVILKNSHICQAVLREFIKDAFLSECALIFVTTNLKTQKLKFRLEAYGEYSEGAIILFRDEIYKVSRDYDPSRSFDFKTGRSSIRINHKNYEGGGLDIKDFETLRGALLFGALDLNGQSDDFNALEERLKSVLLVSIEGFWGLK